MTSCVRCKSEKSDDEFYPSQRRKGSWCKACFRAYNLAHPALRKYFRGYRLKSEHGITTEDFDRMLAAQGGRCANPGCRRTTERPLQVDHDHSCCPGRKKGQRKNCGKCIRGLLCFTCNAAAGNLQDDTSRILGLNDYVTKTKFPAGIGAALLGV